MRFVDEVLIRAKAGDGGHGKVGFHREKFVTKGGPDGGDGGKGGDVILRADRQLGTLMDLYYTPNQKAENGEPGGSTRCHGKDGKDLLVRVPVGTEVHDNDTGEVLADLVAHDQEFRLKGGRGGAGNHHFATPTRQTPDFAKPGKPGEARDLRLILKLLADVGIVGMPNAGKSTLLASVSSARPKIADHPFSTLSPNLGVVKLPDGGSLVMADMPGLIEGASEGAGLGDRFLRHVSRVPVMVHLIEGGPRDGRDPIADYDVIRKELKAYSPELTKRPEMVVLSKGDLAETADVESVLRPYLRKKRKKLWVISAATGEGMKQFLRDLGELVQRARTSQGDEAAPARTEYSPLD